MSFMNNVYKLSEVIIIDSKSQTKEGLTVWSLFLIPCRRASSVGIHNEYVAARPGKTLGQWRRLRKTRRWLLPLQQRGIVLRSLYLSFCSRAHSDRWKLWLRATKVKDNFKESSLFAKFMCVLYRNQVISIYGTNFIHFIQFYTNTIPHICGWHLVPFPNFSRAFYRVSYKLGHLYINIIHDIIFRRFTEV